LRVTADGRIDEQLEVKEHALTNVGGGRRLTCDVKVSVVQLADCASHAGTKEVGHKIDIVAGKVSMVGEMALIEGA